MAPGDHLHAERPGDIGGARAELAEAEDAERHAFEVRADRALPARSGVQPGVLVADVARQLEHQPDGDAGGRAAERARAADHDAARLRRLNVDRGVAHAGGDQQLEVGQRLDHLARKTGALAHGDDDRKLLERRDDVSRPAEMLVENLDVHIAFDFRPIGDFMVHILIVVENCAARRHDSSIPRDALARFAYRQPSHNGLTKTSASASAERT